MGRGLFVGRGARRPDGHLRVFQNAQWWRRCAVRVGAMWSGARDSGTWRGQCGDDGPFGSALRAKRVQ